MPFTGAAAAIDELTRSLQKMTAGPITYKTHFLVGVLHVGGTAIIGRWDHVPTQKDLKEAIDKAPTSYDGFVLTATVGDVLNGNYVASPTADYGYCG